MSLYYYAAQVGFEPKPGQVLALLREAPDGMRNFPDQNWQELYTQGAVRQGSLF
jgi:hypothetical protein